MSVDATKLSFTSAFRYERVVLKGNTIFSVGAFGTVTKTIPHNLGYVPYVVGFYTYNSATFFRLFSGPSSYGIGGNGGQVNGFYADSTNLYVQMSENNGGSISGTIYYRIYAEAQA